MAHDPKYDFEGGIYHRLGGYFLPDDEPVMLFRGKDQATLGAIRGYLAFLEQQEQTALVLDHIQTATERLRTISEWQRTHPDRVGLGCHTCQKAIPI